MLPGWNCPWGSPMRNLVLGLLLANILVLIWQRWVLPPAAEDPYALPGGRVPSLLLMNPAPAKSEPARAASTGLPPAPRCRRIGPFSQAETSRIAADRLTAKKLKVFRYSQAGKIWTGHWVQVPGLASRAAADQVLRSLAAVGLNDAYLINEDGGYLVSLGVFRSAAGAKKVSALARKAKIDALTIDRYRTGTEYWLVVDDPAGVGVNMGELGSLANDILRSEAAPCSVPLDGGQAADSLE